MQEEGGDEGRGTKKKKRRRTNEKKEANRKRVRARARERKVGGGDLRRSEHRISCGRQESAASLKRKVPGHCERAESHEKSASHYRPLPRHYFGRREMAGRQ